MAPLVATLAMSDHGRTFPVGENQATRRNPTTLGCLITEEHSLLEKTRLPGEIPRLSAMAMSDHEGTFPVGENQATRKNPITLGRTLTDSFHASKCHGSAARIADKKLTTKA